LTWWRPFVWAASAPPPPLLHWWPSRSWQRGGSRRWGSRHHLRLVGAELGSSAVLTSRRYSSAAPSATCHLQRPRHLPLKRDGVDFCIPSLLSWEGRMPPPLHCLLD
jgi:hypothetical protein